MPTKVFVMFVRWIQETSLQLGLRSLQPNLDRAGQGLDSYDWQGLNAKYPFASF